MKLGGDASFEYVNGTTYAFGNRRTADRHKLGPFDPERASLVSDRRQWA